MDAATFTAMQHQRRFESDCSLARQKILRAQTVADVVRAADIHPPAWLRMLVRREAAVLSQEAQRKVGALVDAQTRYLRTLDGAAREQQIRKLRQDWGALRGHYPQLAMKTHRLLLAEHHAQQPTGESPDI